WCIAAPRLWESRRRKRDSSIAPAHDRWSSSRSRKSFRRETLRRRWPAARSQRRSIQQCEREDVLLRPLRPLGGEPPSPPNQRATERSSTRASLRSKLRRTLAEEGIDAFGEVGAVRDAREVLQLAIEVVVEPVHAGRLIEQLLRDPQGLG